VRKGTSKNYNIISIAKVPYDFIFTAKFFKSTKNKKGGKE
jgi:hypothetical protein